MARLMDQAFSWIVKQKYADATAKKAREQANTGADYAVCRRVHPSPPALFSTINLMEFVMTATDTLTSQPQLIAVSRLEKSPHNARRTSAKASLEEMKASLLRTA